MAHESYSHIIHTRPDHQNTKKRTLLEELVARCKPDGWLEAFLAEAQVSRLAVT